jgi:hypothetical protein
MGILGVGEPGIGSLIIFFGAWINRDFKTPAAQALQASFALRDDQEMGLGRRNGDMERENSHWRVRELYLFGHTKTVKTPNTTVFRHKLPSKILLRFPFLMEIVYWTLIYSVGLDLFPCSAATTDMDSGVSIRPRATCDQTRRPHHRHGSASCTGRHQA